MSKFNKLNLVRVLRNLKIVTIWIKGLRSIIVAAFTLLDFQKSQAEIFETVAASTHANFKLFKQHLQIKRTN